MSSDAIAGYGSGSLGWCAARFRSLSTATIFVLPDTSFVTFTSPDVQLYLDSTTRTRHVPRPPGGKKGAVAVGGLLGLLRVPLEYDYFSGILKVIPLLTHQERRTPETPVEEVPDVTLLPSPLCRVLPAHYHRRDPRTRQAQRQALAAAARDGED